LAETLTEQAIEMRQAAESVFARRRHGCPCELILKDVSTVRGEADRLTRWERLAREVSVRSG